jgi:hypothetical protein
MALIADVFHVVLNHFMRLAVESDPSNGQGIRTLQHNSAALQHDCVKEDSSLPDDFDGHRHIKDMSVLRTFSRRNR